MENMNTEDISFADLKRRLDLGEKRFKNLCIEDFDSALECYNLEGVIFHNCFVNFNFKNCNLDNSVFIGCNLKTISMLDCSMNNCCIDQCSIESLEIRSESIKNVIFGPNWAYGNHFDSMDCQKMYFEENGIQVPKTILEFVERRKNVWKRLNQNEND